MIAFITRLFAVGEANLSEAGLRDAPALAQLHAACFGRGWSEEEFARLLIEQNVVVHRGVVGRAVAGFIV
jgi:hypothetical protein